MSDPMKTLNLVLAKVLKRLHYPLDVILTCVRWYVAYPLSLRHLEEMMSERALSVEHSTVHWWCYQVRPEQLVLSAGGLVATVTREWSSSAAASASRRKKNAAS